MSDLLLELTRHIKDIERAIERLKATEVPGVPVTVAVTRAAGQTIGNGVWTPINFTSELWDTHGMHDNATNNSRLTCVIAGKYHVDGLQEWDANAVGTRGIRAKKGGATVVLQGDMVNAVTEAGHPTRVNLGGTVQMAVGEWLELEGYQSRGGDLAVIADGVVTPYFCMARVG